MKVDIKPKKNLLMILIQGLYKATLTALYREKQNSSCFFKHSLMSSVDTVELPSPRSDHIDHQFQFHAKNTIQERVSMYNKRRNPFG